MLVRMLALTAFALSSGFTLAVELRMLPPVEPLTRAILQQREARKQARRQGTSPQPTAGTLDDPEYKALFDAFMDRLALLQCDDRPQPTLDGSMYLVDQLYEDMANTELNRRWQDMVVDEIRHLASRPAIEPDVVDVLREGLLAYSDAGGGGGNPFVKIRLAKALTVLGGPAHPECDRRAVELTEDAVNWADRLQSEHYIRLVQKNRGKILAIARSREITPAQRQVELQEADRLIRALSLGEDPDARMVETAARLASVDFGRPDLNDDMIARLLTAYRMTLEPKRRAHKDVVRAIDERLLWLARDSGRLAGERHWSLWAAAATNLGARASHDLKRFVFQDGPDATADPVVIRALDRVRAKLKQ